MRFVTLALCFAPAMVFAAGSDEEVPPEPSETTEVCEDGLVWDRATQTCMPPEQSTNDDEARLKDIRELAYDGQYHAALDVLRTLDDQFSQQAMAYYGFTHRKSGRHEIGMAYYREALLRDPDNLLARSYMGLAHVEKDQLSLAEAQLVEIQARGGVGTWPEKALMEGIEKGVPGSY